VSKNKNQNAVKHGAFAEVVILPGEDVREFEELHQALINEWNPDGPAELDAVWTLTKCLWRKRRLARYQQNEVATWEDGESESRRRGQEKNDRDIKMLLRFVEDVESGSLGSVTEENLETKLEIPWSEYYKIRFKRKDYASDSAWLASVVDDIKNWLTPNLLELKRRDHPKAEEVFCNGEYIARELALEERIDMMIDKAIKRICQIKTAKDVVIGFHHAPVKNGVLKQVESPNIRMVQREEDNQ
jgi:hypothetical protein